jgi:hypothetical protein
MGLARSRRRPLARKFLEDDHGPLAVRNPTTDHNGGPNRPIRRGVIRRLQRCWREEGGSGIINGGASGASLTPFSSPANHNQRLSQAFPSRDRCRFATQPSAGHTRSQRTKKLFFQNRNTGDERRVGMMQGLDPLPEIQCPARWNARNVHSALPGGAGRFLYLHTACMNRSY